MDRSDMEALFARTIAGDLENEKAWAAVEALRQNGDRAIFEYAAVWCRSASPRERARGAAVLCQLRRADDPPLHPEWLFRDESWPLIMKMLDDEWDADVLDSAISALGHLGNPDGIPRIVSFRDHPDRKVRFAVTFALGCFPDDPRSVESLVMLTLDAEADVRDWAAFGLGVLGDADSDLIRTALLRCLEDDDENVREEAAVGLAKRGELKVLPKLLEMLVGWPLPPRAAEAAATLLGMNELPVEWDADEYKAALRSKFQLDH
jgi:HEAT repeat protein